MKFDNLIIISATSVVLFLLLAFMFDSYFSAKKDIEFAKAGLIQKEIGYGRVIWVKPEKK